jgi:hypothetical protein
VTKTGRAHDHASARQGRSLGTRAPCTHLARAVVS